MGHIGFVGNLALYPGLLCVGTRLVGNHAMIALYVQLNSHLQVVCWCVCPKIRLMDFAERSRYSLNHTVN